MLEINCNNCRNLANEVDGCKVYGGDPVQLGEGTPEASFTIEMEPGEAWEKFRERFIKPVAEAYRQYIRNLAASYVAWCMENHPDWVRILRRTKKKRTRKKYHDRLLRAFLEEVNRGKE